MIVKSRKRRLCLKHALPIHYGGSILGVRWALLCRNYGVRWKGSGAKLAGSWMANPGVLFGKNFTAGQANTEFTLQCLTLKNLAPPMLLTALINFRWPAAPAPTTVSSALVAGH
ncbi:hypothetical protein DLD77_10125 [Chitinophaga alhagiae]|uniref:Uncharacterized protein n=1 Tax=Chitinophaga alhagiae TaxID=2203219 RepID=A0ABM6WDK5_9BACT|nr:hypothetical protein DLD77_10125 [Chitinophaga alhagiae]